MLHHSFVDSEFDFGNSSCLSTSVLGGRTVEIPTLFSMCCFLYNFYKLDPVESLSENLSDNLLIGLSVMIVGG